MATRQEIAKLYVATFNRAADASGLAYWDGTGAVTTSLTDIEDIASAMLESPEAAALYAGLDREATVIKMYDNLFNRTVDGTDTGVIYWVSGGGSTVDLNLMIKALIDGALGADKTTINNKATVGTAFADAGLDSISQAISVMQDVTSDSSTVTDALQVINEVAGNGNTYSLSTDTDIITGTAGDDMFEAYLGQNSTAGGVSNTLSSADKLAGGAGEDSLYAQIVPEFFGSTGDNQIDIQVRTSGIENVEFEARDSGSNDGTTVAVPDGMGGYTLVETNLNALVTVDAKDMTGVEKIGSTYSDGDLVIENLTTLTDAGEIRHTSAMTITMDHTDNMNSDEDASDLTVYFDEDYLNTTTSESGSSLTINMINSLNLAVADGSSLIEGFETITFSVGADLITINVAGKELSEVQGLIEAALADAGYADITVSTYTEPAYFATNIYYEQTGTTYKAGDYAGTYTAFLLTNSGSEALTEGGFTIADGQNDGSLAYSQDDNEATTSTNPISINIELEKVGRDGEGGNLIIGGKDQNLAGDTDVDQHDGINVFNITVIGDEDKPSNLGIIQSTNNELDIVTVASATGTDAADAAALTVRGDASATNSNSFSTRPFGGNLTTFDANAFLGDLYIGQDVAASNIDTFTATGGGNVLLNEQISADNTGGGSFASLNDNAYTVTTGAGNDTITVDANSGAQLTVTTGAGNDAISVSIDGSDDSGSDETYATISSSAGNNTVTVTSSDATHDAEITLGSGADTVNGNSVNITVSTGSGNDTIYTNNTATKAIIENDVADNTVTGATAINSTTGAGATPDQSELLYGRSVVVTLATEGITADEFVQGYESISVDIEASNGYLTTTTDLHNAIAAAINTDPVLSKLASATVDSNGTLTVKYLVDGAIDVVNNPAIEYTITGDWADLNTVEQDGIIAQLEEQYSDSDLIETGANSVEAAYDTANITLAQSIADNGDGQNGTDSADGDNNTVNAGLGDDVIVLSSDDAATDTIEIDANGFGNDVVVHFETGATGDVFDFAHLNNVTSASTSTVSQIDITGTVATATTIAANSVIQVALTDLTDNDALATSAMTFATLTNSGVLNEINAAADFGIAATPTDFVGNLVNSIFMVEDNTNDGFYKVFEVVYNTTTSTFTEATLVGTLDFEASVTLDDANIA